MQISPTGLAQELGRDHPVMRAQYAVERAAIHMVAVVAGIVAAGVLVTLNRRLAYHVGLAEAVVGIAVIAELLIANEIRRLRIEDMILADIAPSAPAVQRQIDRLCRRQRRGQLASSLERALDAGERWCELLPASRPPIGARELPHLASEIHSIAHRLRGDPVSPRAVVMVERLMRGGYSATAYGGNLDTLRREITRIQFELSLTPMDPRS